VTGALSARNIKEKIMRPLGFPVLIVFFVISVAVLSSVAQSNPPAIPNPQAAANTPPSQPPSKLKFAPPHVPKPVPGQPFAWDLCHGGPGNITHVAGTNNPDWDAMAADIANKQCGGLSDPKPTTVTGTDGPVHFELAPGGFPPLGMHLGLNGMLYGTPKPHQTLWRQQPFRVCAVSLGGYQDCHEVPFDGATAAKNASHAKTLALVGGGAAVTAVGAGMAMKTVSSSSGGGSCGTPPANIFNDCFSHPQSPNCPSDISQYNSFCKCEGYAGGFDTVSGSCVQ
jgi:hypothetical protein